jgi:hypothetical protein
MLKKSASFVLASLRGSTYRSVRFASSLIAALLDGLFEHPADNKDIQQSLCQRGSLAVFEKSFVPCVNISRFLGYRRETRRQRAMTSRITTESILIHT